MTTLTMTTMIFATMTESPDLFTGLFYLAIVAVAVLISVGLRRLTVHGEEARQRRWVPAVYILVWSLALLFILLHLASFGFGPVLVLAIIGLVGLASASMGWLRDVVAGLLLMSEGQLATCDRIEVGQSRGEIVELGVRAASLRDLDGITRLIPYREVLGSPVARFDDDADTICEVDLRVDTDEEPLKVVEIVQTIASAAPLASPRRRPQVHLIDTPSSAGPLTLRLICFPADSEHRLAYRSDIVQRVQRRFKK